ncbi:sphingomyelin phosphodiesterase [Cytobacillus sp. IB215316]|uniref:sphingomyelin phosphodiesterase n=1 Tax=Cytobacillus sp. IB215316 TaxID=3097354 RepID=UPI002A0BC48C|nr:sphingomyelin phosphodiesterase [Cytobacillus sp. IB215316]MDX8362693.1 sphingomyelin phosphodiesterase [Cytobacillus sp. IB215316]
MKKWIVALSSILAIVSIFPISVPNANDNYPNDFKLLQHNVFLLPTYITSWGQADRAKMIGEADYMKNQDAIILNELFDNSASETLLSKLEEEYPFQTPVSGRSKDGWDETLGFYSNFVPEDGGVSIVSKWPIVEQIQYVYEKGCGADYFANKGFVYAKIQKNDYFYHIIGTHAQADDTGCGDGEDASIRQTQFQEISNFVKEKNIPIEEVVFLGGDFNVIMDNEEEYTEMLETLNVDPPGEYTGHSSTWDPETNGILGYEYPDFGPQHLDYIFVEKDHAQPSLWVNEVLNVKSPVWTAILNEYNEYSDHYPVAGYSR